AARATTAISRPSRAFTLRAGPLVWTRSSWASPGIGTLARQFGHRATRPAWRSCARNTVPQEHVTSIMGYSRGARRGPATVMDDKRAQPGKQSARGVFRRRRVLPAVAIWLDLLVEQLDHLFEEVQVLGAGDGFHLSAEQPAALEHLQEVLQAEARQ